MKHHYLRWFLSLVAAGVMTTTSAQITLHEATNVTQTKATLSAEFPDLSVEHGFQYKYGTLPEIDDFSRTALAPQSDPVQISTTGSYAWSARTAKGWVESNTSVPVGQASSMSAEITLTEETPISFEWAVDSEDNIGIFSFIVDGETIGNITGLIDFEKFTYTLPEGTHKLEWQYKKKVSTNIGLDLCRIRNIYIQDTTSGIWEIINTLNHEIELVELLPNRNYIFRAFQGNSYSSIKSFHTKDVSIEKIYASEITQSQAEINLDVNSGDANLKYSISTVNYNDDLAALFSPDSEIPDIVNPDGWHAYDEKFVGTVGSFDRASTKFKIQLTLEQDAEISFNCSVNGGKRRSSISGSTFTLSYLSVLDKIYESKAVTRPTDAIEEAIYLDQKFSLSAGYHEVVFELVNYGSGSSVAKIWNLHIKNIVPTPNSEYQDLPIRLSQLSPGKTYKTRIVLSNASKNELNERNWSIYSPILTFQTLPISALASYKEDMVTQSTATIEGEFIKGDADIISSGLIFKEIDSNRWQSFARSPSTAKFIQKIERLKPGHTYIFRTYIQAKDCDTVFSESRRLMTKAVLAHKPEILRLAQHEATLQGKVIFGDANIYQRGMQFRKKGVETWEEVEDGGNDSIYTLVRKNLEMGATYQARTYVQPAGCDVIYSDILEFTTLNSYFTRGEDSSTQTTVTFEATLADVDEGLTVDEYGFEYYIYHDGFHKEGDTCEPSDIFTIPVVPDGKTIRTTVTGLAPQLRIEWQAYAIINGEKLYFREYYVDTKRATLKAVVKKITPTSISLELDATQDGDAIVSQIEYALAETYNDKVEYSVCGDILTLTKLSQNTKYNFCFRGLVNDRYCPLLASIDWDYSWFTFKTSWITADVKFSNITQTTAEMDIAIDAGDDIEVTNLRYCLDYGEWQSCTDNVKFKGLTPDRKHYIWLGCTINGREYTLLDEYSFTTKSVSAYVYFTDVQQTSASITAGASYGDATLVAQGYEVAGVTYDNSKGGTVTELMPDTKYTCRSYVETKEGGRIYSSSKEFTTKSIVCSTEKVTSLSNRSATLNGSIDCDANSSAEFGFQWKKMTGWNSDPAFTKGHKLDDGTISVALVNGMLDPDTDYQCRAAVRYNSKIYYGNWVTFRTEAEYVYYPASVYTVFRTDRENNSLVLCGYYIAGSESIVSQGYEYWKKNPSATHPLAAQSPAILTTDESMQHTFSPGELPAGDYSVRAFVKTESGETIYGPTLGFTASNSGYSEVEEIPCDTPSIKVESSIVKIYNAAGLDCIIARINGVVVASRTIINDYEELTLTPGYYIVKLSNGLIEKIRL